MGAVANDHPIGLESLLLLLLHSCVLGVGGFFIYMCVCVLGAFVCVVGGGLLLSI